MSAGLLGCMTTPAQGNRIPDGCDIGADNGKFGKGWRGPDIWWNDLKSKVERYGADRFVFAVAPDVPYDAEATLAESVPWLSRIRSLGVPAAYAAQDGSENGLVPWGELRPRDVLFIGGADRWKEGPESAELAHEAHRRGLRVHMGRVNTRRRLLVAAHRHRADTVDGTTLAIAPKNLAPLLAWLREVNQAPIWEVL